MKHHIVSSSTKVYIRHRENYPETIMMASALEGFLKLGAEIVPYYWVDDVDGMDDLSSDTMVVGYICDVHRALRKMNVTIPESIDYPDSLTKYLGREVTRSSLKEVRASDEIAFIKPVEQKLFTGFVWQGRKDEASRRRIVQLEDSTEVFTCAAVDMLSEYRAMILDGEILDVRRYKGDWSLAPSSDVVKSAVSDFQDSGKAPASYTLDFAITKYRDSSGGYRHDTVLVEANDGFAFGNYGLLPEAYSSCLAARWKDMVK